MLLPAPTQRDAFIRSREMDNKRINMFMWLDAVLSISRLLIQCVPTDVTEIRARALFFKKVSIMRVQLD